MDTLRTNVRTQQGHISYLQVIKNVYSRRGGVLNFYRGIGLYWMSQVPIFAITMGAFEKMMSNKI